MALCDSMKKHQAAWCQLSHPSAVLTTELTHAPGASAHGWCVAQQRGCNTGGKRVLWTSLVPSLGSLQPTPWRL